MIIDSINGSKYLNIYPNQDKNTQINTNQYSISFNAMKKSAFDGIDLLVVEKFKAPIEKFNMLNDFQSWCKDKVKKYSIIKDYGGRSETVQRNRRTLMSEWAIKLQTNQDEFSSATSLFVLSGISQGFKPNNDSLPPSLNVAVLEKCIKQINDEAKQDRRKQFNLNKIYVDALRKTYNSEKEKSKWIVIPSKKHSIHDFHDNVAKLQLFSHPKWCTKSFHALPYLAEGDFHIYMENDQAKIGIRFVNNEVQEIQGEENSGEIPVKYLDIVKQHIGELKDCELSSVAELEFENAEHTKQTIQRHKTALGNAIQNNQTDRIMDYFRYDVENKGDGNISILEYRSLNNSYSFSDLGIDENKLFDNIVEIRENATFTTSLATNLGKLENIKGDANFENSRVKDLGNLKAIEGVAIFSNSPVTDLKNLERIGGNVYLSHSNIKSLKNLKEIGGDLYLRDSKIESLGHLKRINGSAEFDNKTLKDLGELEYIGQNAYFWAENLTNTGKIKEIGGNAYFFDGIKHVDVEKIGGKIYFNNQQVESLDELKKIIEKNYN